MSTTQQRDLHNLRALVTGATSGLGGAIAIQLARDGADVTVHGRDAARGEQTVEGILLQGGSARFVAADLSDLASIPRLAKEVGDIDILVNNAGFAMWKATETFEIPGLTTRQLYDRSDRGRRRWPNRDLGVSDVHEDGVSSRGTTPVL